MELIDLVNRSSPPLPWTEGDNIPWNEPGFSQRMLKEHFSQEHDDASRRFGTIDRQVDWIHTTLLANNRQASSTWVVVPAFIRNAWHALVIPAMGLIIPLHLSSMPSPALRVSDSPAHTSARTSARLNFLQG